MCTVHQSVPEPIPKGLNHSAQGCEERATLGQQTTKFLNSERVAAAPNTTWFDSISFRFGDARFASRRPGGDDWAAAREWCSLPAPSICTVNVRGRESRSGLAGKFVFIFFQPRSRSAKAFALAFPPPLHGDPLPRPPRQHPLLRHPFGADSPARLCTGFAHHLTPPFPICIVGVNPPPLVAARHHVGRGTGIFDSCLAGHRGLC